MQNIFRLFTYIIDKVSVPRDLRVVLTAEQSNFMMDRAYFACAVVLGYMMTQRKMGMKYDPE